MEKNIKNLLYISSWAANTPPVFQDIFGFSKQSGGIHLFEQDTNNGSLIHVADYRQDLTIGYFCISPDKKFLYAINEIRQEPGFGSPGGTVHAFSIDPASGKLSYINGIPTAGVFPCYMTIDRNGKYLFIANYGGEGDFFTVHSEIDNTGSYRLVKHFDESSVVVVKINNEGSLNEVCALYPQMGKPSKKNAWLQSSPHAHSINISQSNKLLLITDRGCDKLLMYGFNSENGLLEIFSENNVSGGGGPRNSVFHPKLPCFYVLHEIIPIVSSYAFNEKTGCFSEINTVPTILPDDMPKEDTQDFFSYPHPADIQIHPSGEYLYITNRGNNKIKNTIGIFRINHDDGSLSYIDLIDSNGISPRTCCFDTDGKYFYVGNQMSNNLTVYLVNMENGKLKVINHITSIDRPVCIKSLKLE